MPVTSDVFGQTNDGKTITRYTLKNKNNLVVQVIDFAASISSVQTPDRTGVFADISPGFDNVAAYEVDNPYYGAIVGRVANRISGAKFTLDGQEFKLEMNDPPYNHIHGGTKGWHKLPFKSRIDGDSVVMTLVSPDGDVGYPGEVTCTVTYSLTDEDELVINVHATTTKPTPINVPSHPYFNLSGHDHPTIYDQYVTIYGDRYAVKTDRNVPSGELGAVEGTLYDLRKRVKFADRIRKIIGAPGYEGYDHTYEIGNTHDRKHMARLEDDSTGRVVDLYSTQGAVHMYTGNFIENVQGKGGATYNQHSGVALEAQNFPDAINQPSFPDCVLRPDGEPYNHTTWFKFSVK